MNTREIYWNTMIEADRLIQELSQLAYYLKDQDPQEENAVISIIHLLGEVRTECGIRTE